jgi:hypothetical protein
MSGAATFLGNVAVHTVSGRGFTPEEIAERALDKIVSVSDDAPPVIRDQAMAYRDHIRQVLIVYMYEAIRSDRVTLTNKLTLAGHPELVALLDA